MKIDVAAPDITVIGAKWHMKRATLTRALFAAGWEGASLRLPGGRMGILQSALREDGSGRSFELTFNLSGKPFVTCVWVDV